MLREDTGSRKTFVSMRDAIAALAVIIVSLLLPAHASAQRWTYASSDRFEVYTTGGDRRARAALTYFERVHGFLEDFLDLSPAQKHPTRLIVFSNPREFAPYRLDEIATAHSLMGPDRDYIVMRSLDAESYPFAVHAYAHVFLRHARVNYPRWLVEGLAGFFSTLAPERGQMSLGRVPVDRLTELRVGPPMMDLPRLFAVDHNSEEYSARTHAGSFYAQSWALVHMFMTADTYRQSTGKLLAAINGGQPTAAAIEATYGKPLTGVFSDLQAHVQSDRFATFSAPYREPPAESTLQTRAVAAFESGLLIANLIADSAWREDEARTAYDALLRQRSDDVLVLDARGLFEFRLGRREAAQEFLTKAIGAGSQNASVYRSAAMLASSDEQRETWLGTAMSLDPENTDIRLSYAFVLGSRRKLEEAFAVMQPVTHVPSELAYTFYELKALVAVQLDRLDEAKAAATLAQTHASTDGEKIVAAELMRSIESRAARRAAAPGQNAPAP